MKNCWGFIYAEQGIKPHEVAALLFRNIHPNHTRIIYSIDQNAFKTVLLRNLSNKSLQQTSRLVCLFLHLTSQTRLTQLISSSFTSSLKIPLYRLTAVYSSGRISIFRSFLIVSSSFILFGSANLSSMIPVECGYLWNVGICWL